MNDATFEARVSPLKVVLLIVGGLVLAAGGAFILLYPDEFPMFLRILGLPVRISYFAWAAVLFFIPCAIGWARQLWRRGPVIEIGPQGVRWRRWSDEIIPWTAFERAEALAINRQKMLSLWLIDPQAHRSTKLLGRLAGANKAMGFGDISLMTQGTDRRFEDMADAVLEHAPELFGR